MKKKLIILFLLLHSAQVAAVDINSHETGIWAIAETETMQRWIIIHNLSEARSRGVFHIEVIGRNNGDAMWQIKHLVPHMAITREALKNSVVKPLKKGGVYPETYDYAYSEWLKENDGTGGSICRTSVLECM